MWLDNCVTHVTGTYPRLEVEAGPFVDWRGGPEGLRRASWRGLTFPPDS
jgi:hypothetical protein